VTFEALAEVASGGVERLEASGGTAAVVEACDALVLAPIKGENTAGGQGGGACGVQRASSCGVRGVG
jgi:hypothetical protein